MKAVLSLVWFLGVVSIGHATSVTTRPGADWSIGHITQETTEQTTDGNIRQTTGTDFEQTTDKYDKHLAERNIEYTPTGHTTDSHTERNTERHIADRHIDQTTERQTADRYIERMTGVQTQDRHSEKTTEGWATDKYIEPKTRGQTTDKRSEKTTGGQTTDKYIEQKTGGQITDKYIEQKIGGQATGKHSEMTTEGQTTDKYIEHTSGGQTTDRPIWQATNKDMWYQKAQTLCPALNFCTKASLQNISIPAGKQLCCAQCSCDESCWLYNNCCPDVDIPQLETGYQHLPCRNTRYRREYRVRGVTNYRMIDWCPSSFTDKDVTYKCTRNTSDIDTYGDIVTVSSARDHDQIFRNKFCAACNGVHHIVKWELVLSKCTSNPVHFTLRGHEVIPSSISDCQLHSIPSNDLHLTYKSTCLESVISECNITGKWKTYDPYLEQACKLSAFPVYDVRGHPTYRNAFCYFCNYPDDSLTTDTCTKLPEGRLDHVRFSAFLDLDDKYGQTESKTKQRCADDEMYCSILRACRRVYCPAFTYGQSSECRPLWLNWTPPNVEVILKINLNQTCSRSCLEQIADGKIEGLGPEPCTRNIGIVGKMDLKVPKSLKIHKCIISIIFMLRRDLQS